MTEKNTKIKTINMEDSMEEIKKNDTLITANRSSIKTRVILRIKIKKDKKTANPTLVG